MLRRATTLALAIITGPFTHGTQWTVGAGETYTLPSQVAPLVSDGDTVNIAVGIYASDVTNWTAHDLLLRGVGGIPVLDANFSAWEDKAIWVIEGDRNTVQGIQFQECHSTDMNGAGIRLEGHHLTVKECDFRLNENGILVGAISPCNISVENSEFAYNGAGGGGFAHNVYIGHIDTLFFRYNYSHHTHDGHEIKSRATVNFIEYNRFSNETNGAASYEIDIPNGGEAYIIGNMLHQGNQGTNSSMIAYGAEGLSNDPPHELYAINNTLLNTRTVGNFFFLGAGQYFVKLYNNIFAGRGNVASSGFLPMGHDTLANVKNEVFALFEFVDVNNYDYHILSGSIATSAGFPAGLSNSGYPLVALEEYVHPASSTVRCQHALLDAGAFETCTTGNPELERTSFALWPNPTSDRLYVRLEVGSMLELIDIHGRVLHTTVARQNIHELDLNGMASGAYLIRVDGTRSQRFIIP